MEGETWKTLSNRLIEHFSPTANEHFGSKMDSAFLTFNKLGQQIHLFESTRSNWVYCMCRLSLAYKPMDSEIPQAVLPNIVFEAFVGIPYDMYWNKFLLMVKWGLWMWGLSLFYTQEIRISSPWPLIVCLVVCWVDFYAVTKSALAKKLTKYNQVLGWTTAWIIPA